MPELPERRVEPVHQRLRTWRTGRLLVDTCRAHLAAAGEHPAVQITVDGTPEPQP